MHFFKFDHWIIDQIKHAATYITTGWRRHVLMVLLGLLTIYVIARIIVDNWELLSTYDWDIQPAWLVYGLIFFVIDLVVSLYAWHLLVSRLAGFSNFRRSSKIYLQSNLARRLPGSVWFLASRAVLYKELGVRKTTTSMLGALEMAFFILSGGIVTAITLPFWIARTTLIEDVKMVWAVFLVLPLAILLVHPRALQRIWGWIIRSGPKIHLTWRDTVIWLGVYVGTWILGGMVLVSVINVFQRIQTTDIIMIIGIWSIAGTIALIGFVTIAFFSLRDITLVILLSPFVPLPIALIIAIVIRLIWLSGELLGALVATKL